MRFLETKLDGAWLIEPEPIRDSRGYFARTFCTRDFEERGLESRFVQHSRSFSATKGTLRGLHFQTAPHEEVKLVSCVSGAVFDVIVDMRPESPSYRQWQGFELSADNKRQLYVPAGFAHGFQTLTDDAELNYLISAFYEPAASTGISYDDPALGVTWPLPVSVISDRDRSWGPLLAA
jgi:dTDP-4-dehydrorhamnose 3,5-epimerase